MKISWLKYEKDKDSFKLPEALGLDVYKIPYLEDSEDIIKKYNKDNNVKIIISIDKDIL